ncbi:StbB family protein [Variovorax ginsengisoli]|uniref:Cellulose biosynthesis protein BcsQ n=1 Tax=Variovorax ginsengisoli TaxID=363844 RepID=A0ABT9SEU9_9BURK|nr:StbB family protein [Variovorax ginsengisoli]MDP9902419.1 cellulose biosynthesis protein BcsQ [Variovorax ginsengisoli]
MNASACFKVAVLNYSGNVGKTTLARHLLQPRMGNCPILFVETMNEGGDETNVKGKDFASVMIEVLASDSAIVDIGSSNIEQVFAKVGQMGDVLDGFDFILIPTVAKAKQQADTLKVLRDLLDLGVTPDRLKLVLNHVDSDDDVEKVFDKLLKFAGSLGIAHAVVHESDGFAHLAHRTVAEVAAAGRDFRKEIAAADTKETKRELATAQIFSRIAQGIERELDSVFVKLFEPA